MNILTHLRARFAGEEGATATEYVFLLVFIAIAIVTAVGFLGGALDDGFTEACQDIDGALTTDVAGC